VGIGVDDKYSDRVIEWGREDVILALIPDVLLSYGVVVTYGHSKQGAKLGDEVCVGG
jgi:hypothetical protein